jgi:hypothetical protein
MNTQNFMNLMPARSIFVLILALSCTVATLAGCTYSRNHHDDSSARHNMDVVPDEPGVYALTGDDVTRLDGDADWEASTWGQRSTLPPDAGFVVRDPGLAGVPPDAATEVLGLWRVAWVRSTITDAGEIIPVTSGNWQRAPLPALAVPLGRVEQPESHADVIRVLPRDTLEPGLYAIQLQTGQGTRTARFGVEWPGMDKQAYAAAVCVDHYLGAGAGYRPCGEQAAAGTGDALQILLVEPETRESGSGRSVVISGVIVNQSSRTRTVPLLAAELRDMNGQPLSRWRFKAPKLELEPGEATSFRTESGDAPSRVHSVNVDFTSSQAAN